MNTLQKYAVVLPALMVIGSAIGKLVGAEDVVKQLIAAGIHRYVYALGVAELVFCALWLYHKTSRIGFFLLCGYFGGAIATDLHHLDVILAPILILSLIWITSYLRDSSLFLAHE
jgi:hypothetical protein